MSLNAHIQSSTLNQLQEDVAARPSSTVSADASTSAQCEGSNEGPNTTRQRGLPGKLARLPGAKDHFIVNGEKWVQSDTTHNKRTKRQNVPRKPRHDRLREIRSARDFDMLLDPPFEQPEMTDSHELSVESIDAPAGSTFTIDPSGGFGSDSPLSIGFWSTIDAYLPPQSSSDAMPRALARSKKPDLDCLLEFSPYPHVHHPGLTSKQTLAATLRAIVQHEDESPISFNVPVPCDSGPSNSASEIQYTIPRLIIENDNGRQTVIYTPQPQLHLIPGVLESAAYYSNTENI